VKRIYLDNAATTPLDPQVIEVMTDFMKEHYGNPSSTHAYGRKTKDAIETCRRKVAQHLNCSPAEICFTSGGTEADNLAIYNAIHKLEVKDIITTRIEHAAVVKTVLEAEKAGLIRAHWLELDEKGQVNLDELDSLLATTEKTLVSLMHANNEIANRIDLKEVSKICRRHKALFHSDTVQTMAHYRFDLEEIDIDFITGAAHKFHGPKGIGFLYHKRELGPIPMIFGGGQERNRRAGTENIYGIIGLTEAMDIAYAELDEHERHVRSLKRHMIKRFRSEIPDVAFNGDSESEDSLYTVLNVNLPDSDISAMILFRLDIEGVACSGGSACSSGNSAGSHVLSNIELKNEGPNIRFSFSKYNTMECVDRCIDKLVDLTAVVVR